MVTCCLQFLCSLVLLKTQDRLQIVYSLAIEKYLGFKKCPKTDYHASSQRQMFVLVLGECISLIGLGDYYYFILL